MKQNPLCVSVLLGTFIFVFLHFVGLTRVSLVLLPPGGGGDENTAAGGFGHLRVGFIIGLSRSTLIQPSSNFPLVSKVPCNIQGVSAAPLGPSGSISPQ